jgi:hypothetical protein
MKWIAWSTIGVSLLLYVAACALPSGVIVGIDPEDEVPGFWCLAGGWANVFAIIAKGALSKHPLIAIWNAFVSLFLWGSNILYFWSIIDTLRAKVRKRTIWLAILAFSASLYYFLFYQPEYLRLGNYLWSASYLVMLIGVVILWWNNYNIKARWWLVTHQKERWEY